MEVRPASEVLRPSPSLGFERFEFGKAAAISALLDCSNDRDPIYICCQKEGWNDESKPATEGLCWAAFLLLLMAISLLPVLLMVLNSVSRMLRMTNPLALPDHLAWDIFPKRGASTLEMRFSCHSELRCSRSYYHLQLLVAAYALARRRCEVGRSRVVIPYATTVPIPY